MFLIYHCVCPDRPAKHALVLVRQMPHLQFHHVSLWAHFLICWSVCQHFSQFCSIFDHGAGDLIIPLFRKFMGGTSCNWWWGVRKRCIARSYVFENLESHSKRSQNDTSNFFYFRFVCWNVINECHPADNHCWKLDYFSKEENDSHVLFTHSLL